MTTYIASYLAAVSLIAIVLTVYDKRAAARNAWRVRERTLMLISIMGGSIAMLVTMRLIRHKTKHLKFMAGIPVIIMLQIIAGFIVWYLLKGITL